MILKGQVFHQKKGGAELVCLLNIVYSQRVWSGLALNQAWAHGELSMLLEIFKLLREGQTSCQEWVCL